MDCKKRIVMTQEEQKNVMLSILIEFDEFCQSHMLQYFLDAGSLLGAVRHKGYIPWDDDIDVNMPRKDWQKFCEIVRTNNGYMSEHLYVEFPDDTIFPFLKIADDRTILVEYPDKNPMEVGVYIDVFPKDGIRDLNWKSKMVCEVSYRLNLIRWFNVFSVHAWRNSTSRLCRFIAMCGRKFIKYPNFPLELQRRWIMYYSKKNPSDQCKYVTTLVNGEFHKCAPKHCFDDYVLLDFEGNKFRAPVGYDMYLRCLYPGNYMELPPIEKRQKHNTEVYWKSEEAREDYIEGKDW